MKILILGASGTVGRALHKTLSTKYEVYGTFNQNKPEDVDDKYWLKYDIADAGLTDDILSAVKPDIVISSLTGNYKNQFLVHKRVAKHLKQYSGFCIFLSTANVFDGSPDRCHSEDDPPYPFSDYGKFKQSCEELLLQSLGEDNCLIVRLPKILAKREISNMIQQVKNGQPIYSNLYMSLNTDENVASAIQYCIDSRKSGTLHLTSYDYMSVDEYIGLLFEQSDENIKYDAKKLTVDEYCAIFNREDASVLRLSGDANFYVALKSIDVDVATRFGLSCREAVMQICLRS